MTTLKVGDKVRFTNSVIKSWWFKAGQTGTALRVARKSGYPIVVKTDIPDTDGHNEAYVDYHMIEKVNTDTITLGVPTIADDLRLKPQARKILAHLRSGQSISPLEAQNVYAVYRLAASICEIKKLGYKIDGVIKQDASGHKYKRYSLAA
jgi:hypothetical protein